LDISYVAESVAIGALSSMKIYKWPLSGEGGFTNLLICGLDEKTKGRKSRDTVPLNKREFKLGTADAKQPNYFHLSQKGRSFLKGKVDTGNTEIQNCIRC
jgi:hypothetical protein